MLSCIVGKNKVNAFYKSKEQLRKWSNKGLLKCPVCGEELIYRHGEIKIPHFAHKQSSDCDFGQGEPETEEHAQGKKYLYKWLKKQFLIKEVELEKWIPEIKQRPDIWFKDDKGKEYCIEYQCSPTTLGHIKEKDSLYKLNNIIPIWIFGTQRISNRSAIFGYLNHKYIFDPIKMMFYKNGNSHYFKRKTNFFFEGGEIFIHNNVSDIFYMKLEDILEERKNGKDELLRKQKEIYNRIIQSEDGKVSHEKAENARKRKELFLEKIRKKLQNTEVTVYNDLKRFNNESSEPKVKYLTGKEAVYEHSVLSAIHYSKVLPCRKLDLYLPLYSKDISVAESWFPYSKITYKRGAKG